MLDVHQQLLQLVSLGALVYSPQHLLQVKPLLVQKRLEDLGTHLCEQVSARPYYVYLDQQLQGQDILVVLPEVVVQTLRVLV